MDVFGVFEVRKDKFCGLLVETLTMDKETYFFKSHDQPLARHCEQVQVAVRSAKVLRKKKIRINLSACLHEYRATDNVVTFKAKPLNSVRTQIEKIATMMVNKELGARKRKFTIEAKKQAKLEQDEARFQAERVARISKLFDSREEADTQI